MRRPALALLVLLGAGWGVTSSAQVANGVLPFTGGAATLPARLAGGGAEPDTVAPWRYYPLAVGNVWEYVEDDGAQRRTTVEKDTAALGRQYFVVRRELARNSEVIFSRRIAVRFDTASASVVSLAPQGPPTEAPFLRCRLDAPFGVTVECDGFESATVTGDAGTLVFGGERPGTGTDTVRATVKRYVYSSIGFEDRYAADVGPVYSEGDGFARALTYYRVGGVERGVARFPVSRRPAPRPGGAATVAVGPNPAGAAAAVWLGLPAPADVRVAVYDALGRRVAAVAAGPLGAGRHRLPLDTQRFAPGAYVVRAEVGGGAAVAARLTVAR